MKKVQIYAITAILGVLILLPFQLKGMKVCRIDSIIPRLSNIEAEDTLRLHELPSSYRDLKKKSSKNIWLKRAFSTIITEPTPPDKLNENRSIIDEYQDLRGKIIRNINIAVLDPFGTDVRDPNLNNSHHDIFNSFHTLTRKSVIEKNLQFRKGEHVNLAVIAETEALLRRSGYINDARITINPLQESNDSVDINVVVRDKWTIGIEIHKITSSTASIEIFDKNLLGTGNRAGISTYYSNKYDKKLGIGGYYQMENVAGTFIDLEASYEDEIKDHKLSLSAARKLQPRLNYFGEISYSKDIIRADIATGWDSISPDFREQFSMSIGRAFTLPSNNSIKRIVLGFRYKLKNPEYKNIDYWRYINTTMKPYENVRNEMWLMQLSLYQNSYLRDYLIHNFGNTEDIAQGYNISMQLGYSRFQDLSIKNGLYTSFKASFGSSKLTKGNIYAEASISSFFSNKKPYGSIFKTRTHYYTPLLRLVGARLRQFIDIEYCKLLTPDRYFGDRIYMGESTTLVMKDYRRKTKGVEQLLIKTETDFFSRYEVLNFSFLFYGFLDAGWNTPGGHLFSNDNLNWGFGIGIRIRNELLVLKTLDLKIGFYPKLDQNGFRSFFKTTSSTPKVSPNFIPSYPEEITFY